MTSQHPMVLSASATFQQAFGNTNVRRAPTRAPLTSRRAVSRVFNVSPDDRQQEAGMGPDGPERRPGHRRPAASRDAMMDLRRSQANLFQVR